MSKVTTLYTHVFVIAIMGEDGEETTHDCYPMVGVTPKGVASHVEDALKNFDEWCPAKTASEIQSTIIAIENCPTVEGQQPSCVLVTKGEFASNYLIYDGENEEGDAVCIGDDGQVFVLPKEHCCRIPSWDWENGGWYYPSEEM